MTRLHRWMDECLSGHKDCLEHSTAQNDSSRPARLLSLTPIQRDSKSGIKLIETASGSSYRYACLSHRWDDGVKHHRTTTENLAKALDFLNLQELPANFRDAVSIARDLDIHYIWIDSICIIQGGDSGEDLRRELAKMGSIYQNAHLTIAAVSSPNSSGGCFMKDTWPDICFLVSNNTLEAHLIGARVLDKKGRLASLDDVNDRYPLLSRAWVFQERLLSPRVLQCNYGEFTFECLESSRCECDSVLAPHPWQMRKWLGNLDFNHGRRLNGLTMGVDAWKDNTLNSWRAIIETYMQLELSFPSDVLPAVAGCAQAMALHLKFNYVAGLWKEMLPTDLLWHVVPHKQGAISKPRPKDSTAPSWSWASVSMRQTITHVGWRGVGWMTSNMLLRDAIKEVCCVPESATNPFGKLKDAYLKLDAVLYPWYLRWYCRVAEQNLTSYHRRHITKDLYIKRSNQPLRCITETQELIVGGAIVEVLLDVHLGDEGLVIETFSHCIGDPAAQRCGLGQIYLLHALHKESLQRSVDVFLLLKRIPPTNGKSNCYRRIGLMKLTTEEANVRTWDEIIHGRIEPRQEEFWLF
jgi:hypothetical protein